MAAKRYDFSRIYKVVETVKDKTGKETPVEHEVLYARGILTCNIPGLAKTPGGKLVTPTLRIDEQGNLQNYFFKNKEPLPLYTYVGDGKEKILEQPAMVGKTQQKKIYLWCNENGTDKYYALEAWEYNAKRMNMFFKKGDQIVITAHKIESSGSTTGTKDIYWRIDDIFHTQPDIVYNKEKTTSTPTTEETPTETTTETLPDGFMQMNDDSDLPFAD